MSISTEDFFYSATTQQIQLAIGMGHAPGYSTVDKFGVNPEITTSTDPEDIWEFGGLYPYDEDKTAPIISISSSSALDTQPVIVQGLDINGYLVSQEIELTGQSLVSFETPLFRVFRMYNDGNVPLEGTVYCYTGTSQTGGIPPAEAVRAIIDNGNNQTLMALYTIPRGYVGFLFRGEMGVELEGNTATLAEYAHCHYESRRFGKVFRVKKAVTIIVGGSGQYQDVRSFPDVIPALTDIKLTAIEVTQTMGLWGTFDIMLVEESRFSDDYLQRIGQPGAKGAALP